MVEDTAWHPVSKQELGEWKGTFKGWLYKTFLGSPLKSWASVGHWLIWHFDLTKYTEKQQDRVSFQRLLCQSNIQCQIGMHWAYQHGQIGFG